MFLSHSDHSPLPEFLRNRKRANAVTVCNFEPFSIDFVHSILLFALIGVFGLGWQCKYKLKSSVALMHCCCIDEYVEKWWKWALLIAWNHSNVPSFSIVQIGLYKQYMAQIMVEVRVDLVREKLWGKVILNNSSAKLINLYTHKMHTDGNRRTGCICADKMSVRVDFIYCDCVEHVAASKLYFEVICDR